MSLSTITDLRVALSRIFALLILTFFWSGMAQAETEKIPCNTPLYKQLDFWIGDWIVYKSGSEEISGIDQIEPILNGCAIHQRWLGLDDSFRPNETDRLRGESLFSVGADGQWRQMWVDNSGYMNMLTGGLEETGDFVLRSGPVEYLSDKGTADIYFEWRWRLNDNGTVRSWGKTKIGADGDWETSFDNLYRPNR